MSKSKTCADCGQKKPVDAFWKLAPHIAKKGGGETHSKRCLECIKASRKPRASKGEEEEETPPEADTRPRLTVANSLGFDVVLEGVDFHITQTNGDDTVTVILAPHELRELWDFAEGMAKSQAGIAAE